MRISVNAPLAAGYIAPWSGRFYSLWDTGYAKIHIPIIASVSEHQPTTWVSFFFDLHILVCVFPAGAWFVIKDINDERVFSESPMEIFFLFFPYKKESPNSHKKYEINVLTLFNL